MTTKQPAKKPAKKAADRRAKPSRLPQAALPAIRNDVGPMPQIYPDQLSEAGRKAYAKLTERQMRLWVEFCATGSRVEAYRRVYGPFPDRNAGPVLANARKTWKSPSLQALLGERVRILETRFLVTEARILSAYAELAFNDPRDFFRPNGKLKGMHELTRDQAACIAEVTVDEIEIKTTRRTKRVTVTKKIKLVDRKGVLDSLAKTRGMFIDVQKGEHVHYVARMPTPARSEEEWLEQVKGD